MGKILMFYWYHSQKMYKVCITKINVLYYFVFIAKVNVWKFVLSIGDRPQTITLNGSRTHIKIALFYFNEYN